MNGLEQLPRHGRDVLTIEESSIPAVVGSLIRNRALSGLVQTIHAEMRSDDPGLQKQAELALKKLGFSD